VFLEKLIVPWLVKDCHALLQAFHSTLKLRWFVQFFPSFAQFFTFSDHKGRISNRLPFWLSSHVQRVT
jgi:hypothetical protein